MADDAGEIVVAEMKGLAVKALGVGYCMLGSLFTQQSVDLSSIGTYFLSGSALFAPYAFNQLSSIFKGGT